MYEAIKQNFPNIPAQVINLWLLSFAEAEGGLPTMENQWDIRISGESLKFWNSAGWKKSNLDLLKIDYSGRYFEVINNLYDAYIFKINNRYLEHLGDDGKSRFRRCLKYILENRKFPQPPILILDELNEYQILDGNHRFVALRVANEIYLEYTKGGPEYKQKILESIQISILEEPRAVQEVWICEPRWEDSENARTRNYLRKISPVSSI